MSGSSWVLQRHDDVHDRAQRPRRSPPARPSLPEGGKRRPPGMQTKSAPRVWPAHRQRWGRPDRTMMPTSPGRTRGSPELAVACKSQTDQEHPVSNAERQPEEVATPCMDSPGLCPPLKRISLWKRCLGLGAAQAATRVTRIRRGQVPRRPAFATWPPPRPHGLDQPCHRLRCPRVSFWRMQSLASSDARSGEDGSLNKGVAPASGRRTFITSCSEV